MANPIIRKQKYNVGAPTTQPIVQSYSFQEIGAGLVDTPPVGVSYLFKDADDGELKIKDENGDLYSFGGGSSGGGGGSSIPNEVINGGFELNERGEASYFMNNLNSYGYTLDRFHAHTNSGGTGSNTITQETFAVGQTDVAGNPKNYMRCVVVAGVGTSRFSKISTRLDDVTKYSGETVTLGVDLKADSAKDVSIEFLQYFGDAGSSAVFGLGVNKISITSTWTRYYVTATLPGVSGKTITNNSHLEVNLFFDAGSNLDARTNTLGRQSGTFDIANFDLKKTGSITPFSRAGDNELTERKLAKYYYEHVYSNLFPVYGDTSANRHFGEYRFDTPKRDFNYTIKRYSTNTDGTLNFMSFTFGNGGVGTISSVVEVKSKEGFRPRLSVNQTDVEFYEVGYRIDSELYQSGA